MLEDFDFNFNREDLSNKLDINKNGQNPDTIVEQSSESDLNEEEESHKTEQDVGDSMAF